jgi:large subunit ribosomal protein L6
MSRIGKQIIKVPSSITINQIGDTLEFKGEKGVLSLKLLDGITIEQKDGILTVSRLDDTADQKAKHGLLRTLINNKIIGVSEGFSKKLEINGVGYRAILEGSNLVLSLGYSHPIVVPAIPEINFKVEKNTITVSGIDNVLVGEIAAKIRSYRKPEPYKGKGIKYFGEKIRRKAGKTAKA